MLPYRPCVGIMLINTAGRIWVGARLDNTEDAWQMPQGGIDEDEDPHAAALRELQEETGIPASKVDTIAETQDWLNYDLPPELMGRMWGGKYRGQKQKWFAMRYGGTDGDINIQTRKPEFRAWKWVAIDELPHLIVPFKRALYQRLVARFRHLTV